MIDKADAKEQVEEEKSTEVEEATPVVIVRDESKPSNPVGSDQDWEVQSAVDCLLRAEEIRQNTEMMQKVQPFLNKKMKALKSITSISDLKKAKAEMDSDDSDEE